MACNDVGITSRHLESRSRCLWRVAGSITRATDAWTATNALLERCRADVAAGWSSPHGQSVADDLDTVRATLTLAITDAYHLATNLQRWAGDLDELAAALRRIEHEDVPAEGERHRAVEQAVGTVMRHVAGGCEALAHTLDRGGRSPTSDIAPTITPAGLVRRHPSAHWSALSPTTRTSPSPPSALDSATPAPSRPASPLDDRSWWELQAARLIRSLRWSVPLARVHPVILGWRWIGSTLRPVVEPARSWLWDWSAAITVHSVAFGVRSVMGASGPRVFGKVPAASFRPPPPQRQPLDEQHQPAVDLTPDPAPDLAPSPAPDPAVDMAHDDARNRASLAARREAVALKIAQLDALIALMPVTERSAFAAARQGRARELDRLDALADAISSAPHLDHADHDRPVMLLDLARDDPDRFVVSLGDPATATRIDVVVPGTGAGAMALAGNLSAEQSLYRREHRATPLPGQQPTRGSAATPQVPTAQVPTEPGATGSVATVVFVDYPAPRHVLAARDPAAATEGSHTLTRLIDRLRTTNPDARVTLTGHSYGAVVAGAALQQPGLAVDAALLVAAPGALATHSSHLTGTECVAAMTSRSDVISTVADAAATSDLGPNPASPAFGAHRWSSRPSWDLWHSYDGYATNDRSADHIIEVRRDGCR